MKTISEEKREVPVVCETDVIVIGGGIAGVAAAIAASRNGARVTLIEKSIVLGGLATLGHVCIYLPLDDGIGHKIYGGLAEELLYTSIKYGFNNLPDCWRNGKKYVENPPGRYRTHFNIPSFVVALDELIELENINVVFDTCFCAPIMEDDTCRGVIVENKSGRTAYLAKMFVDASGDADLMYRAGAKCETQKNIISHWGFEIDFETMKRGIEANDILKALNLRWLGLRPDKDSGGSNLPLLDGTTSEGVNEYIRISRSLARDYIKKNSRSDYAMLTMPYMPQFRMTRRIIGKEEMSLVPGEHVEHSIGCVIHSLEAAPAAVYEFPYEGLLDSRITNIAAAGRIVSAGGWGWEIMRFIPACALSGQAAGTAAALALKSGYNLHNLDIASLQQNLDATGVMVHMDDELRRNRSANDFTNH